MLQVSKQNVINVSGEVEIDLLELIQNRSDFLFGTISSKEGKKGEPSQPSHPWLVRKVPGLGLEKKAREDRL